MKLLRKLSSILWAINVLIVSSASVLAQQEAVHSDLGISTDIQTLVLTYEKSAIVGTPPAGCSDGTLTGNLQCGVTERMGQAGADEESAEAHSVDMTYTLTPILHESENDVWVSLVTQVVYPHLASDLGEAVRRRLDVEARQLTSRLNNWRKDLTEEEQNMLAAGTPVPVGIADMTDMLRLWRVAQRPDLSVAKQPEPESRLIVDVLTSQPVGPKLPFRARLKFERPPGKLPKAATFRWSGGSQSAVFKSGRTAAEFVTDWYYPTDRSAKVWKDGPVFPAQSTAEDFRGTWSVVHEADDGSNASGTAFVSDDGETIRLFLNFGEETRLYEAFETLATTSQSGAGDTLDVRFQRINDSVKWALEDAVPAPKGRALSLPDDIETLRITAEGREIDVDVSTLFVDPDRLQVRLWNRSDRSALTGTWHREEAQGALGEGGRQQWGRAPIITQVIVLEDQRLTPKTLGSYAQFQDDFSPSNREYIAQAPLPNREITTQYPYRKQDGHNQEAGQNDITYRTLFVLGENLPQRASDPLVLTSNDPLISYALEALPGEGKDRLLARGWRASGISARGDLDALVLRAAFKEGVLPSEKTLVLNGAPGTWLLDFEDANGALAFVRKIGEHDADGFAEYDRVPSAMPSDVVQVALDEQSPIPHGELFVELRKNGVALVNDGSGALVPLSATSDGETVDASSARAETDALAPIASLKIRQFSGPSTAEYRSSPIRLIPAGRPNLAPAEIDGALSLEVEKDDILFVRLQDPDRLRVSPPVALTTIGNMPSEASSLWRTALLRAAACYGEDTIDFAALSDEQEEVYSRYILTEELTNDFRKFMSAGGTWRDAARAVVGMSVSPLAYSLREREVFVSRGDHAASILIRDEFIRQMKQPLRALVSIASDEEKLWAIYRSRNAVPMPFWNITEVRETPNSVLAAVNAYQFPPDPGGFTSNVDVQEFARDLARGFAAAFDETVTIADFVDLAITEAGSDPAALRVAHLLAFDKFKDAFRQLVDNAALAETRARTAKDCDLPELLLLAGQDADPVVAQILPRLLKRSDEQRQANWVPDIMARNFVKGVRIKGAEARALEQYGRIDDAYKQMAMALVTVGVMNSAASEFLLGGLEAATFGTSTLDRYIESQPNLDYAEGASVVLGEGFYREAEMLKQEGWDVVADMFLPIGAAGLSAAAAQSGAAVKRGADLIDSFDALDLALIRQLDQRDQNDLFAHFASLKTKGRTGLLNKTERATFNKYADFLRKNGLNIDGRGFRGAGAGALPRGSEWSVIAPQAGRTGVAAQEYCYNCGLTAAEAFLLDRGIIDAERSQAAMLTYAMDRGLIDTGGSTMNQMTGYLERHGVDPSFLNVDFHTVEDFERAIRKGDDVIASIQTGDGGFHWIRVEAIRTDATGVKHVVFGEGSLPKGQSRIVTADEFSRITKDYPTPTGREPQLQAIIAETSRMTPNDIENARDAALLAGFEGHAKLARRARNAGMSEAELTKLLSPPSDTGPRPDWRATQTGTDRGIITGAMRPENPMPKDPMSDGTFLDAPSGDTEVDLAPRRQVPRYRQSCGRPFAGFSVEEGLRRQAERDYVNSGVLFLNASKINRVLTDVDFAEIAENVRIMQMQEHLDEMLDEMRRVGFSNEELNCLIGDVTNFDLNRGQRGDMLRRLQEAYVSRQGWEVIPAETAREFHRQTTSILAGGGGPEQVDYIRGEIEWARLTGDDFFQQMRRRGSYTNDNNFETLLFDEAAAQKIDAFAERNGLR
ncbi:MAG: hypothetical protein AAF683_06570 [Pseudomonadota bacterium]